MFSQLIAGSILALTSTFVSSAGVQFAGINIAGFDFGCATDGHCTLSSVTPPLSGSGGADGPGQMVHFTQVDKFNIFRLPVAWQYLQDTLGATLNTGNLGTYDQLVQGCLKTGAHCIIDIHNYARWDGAIIGQSGGPTNDNFANLWSQLATKYAGEAKVVMGLMNEPHDMPDMSAWATAVQGAVTAIRKAGAADQMILLPGTSYTSAGAFVSDGSAAALNGVKDSDGTTSKLIFDVHNYFDSDGSGTSTGCTSNKISDGFQPLVSFLQANKRQALVSELGGGPSAASCLTDICQALDFLNENSDVYLGWVGWAAGSFDASYTLGLRPNGDTDVPLVTQCFAAKFQGGAGLTGNSTTTGGGANGTTAGGAGGNGVPQASFTAPLASGASSTSGASPFQNGTSPQQQPPSQQQQPPSQQQQPPSQQQQPSSQQQQPPSQQQQQQPPSQQHQPPTLKEQPASKGDGTCKAHHPSGSGSTGTSRRKKRSRKSKKMAVAAAAAAAAAKPVA